MRYYKVLFHSLLLLTLPSIALYPQSNVASASVPMHEVSTEAALNNQFLSYDAALRLLEAIEAGEVEKESDEQELERINYFLVNLAKQGHIPSEPEKKIILEQDIQELLHGEDDSYEYSFFIDRGGDYVIAPAILSGHGEIILCKSWMKKQWARTKKFLKKHKKAIIIGAAVVVAATVVVCAVAAASAAGAAAAGAAAGSGSDKKRKDESEEKEPDTSAPTPRDPSSPSLSINEASILKATLDEHISSFKETIPSTTQSDSTFSENVRDLGAFFAHEALEGVSELASVVPQLLEEIKEIGQKILPESLLQSHLEPEIQPQENYERSITTGHEKIDQVFSTDQAGQYTPEAKESRKDFDIGVIPPNVGFSGKKGWELKNPKFQPSKNTVTTINGRTYRGHALDQMQNRGIPPSAVEHTIEKGEILNKKNLGTTEYYDPVNKIKVVLNDQQEVVTAITIDG
ncbi:MAG: DUF4258 domain-containing protein [Chlamydiales bacterium]|nr:DUF4258 domain-containing protein [Chlamydiales bacterium]